MPRTVATEVTVRYAETDAQGVVHHSNYLVWFELGRACWLKAHGLRYAEWEADGLLVVVAEARARYRAPALYDQTLRIETELIKARTGYFAFAYRVVSTEEQLLCEGETRHLVTDRRHRAARLPDDVFRKLKAVLPAR